MSEQKTANTWDLWRDNLVQQQVHHCGIYGKDGNTWSCVNMCATPDEVKVIESSIAKKDQNIFQCGVKLNNERWAAIKMEDNVLVLKGKDANKEKTMTVRATKQAVIFGANKDSTVQANHVRDVTEKLAGRLEELGY